MCNVYIITPEYDDKETTEALVIFSNILKNILQKNYTNLMHKIGEYITSDTLIELFNNEDKNCILFFIGHGVIGNGNFLGSDNKRLFNNDSEYKYLEKFQKVYSFSCYGALDTFGKKLIEEKIIDTFIGYNGPTYLPVKEPEFLYNILKPDEFLNTSMSNYLSNTNERIKFYENNKNLDSFNNRLLMRQIITNTKHYIEGLGL